MILNIDTSLNAEIRFSSRHWMIHCLVMQGTTTSSSHDICVACHVLIQAGDCEHDLSKELFSCLRD